jgi:N6-adenosine-specific RNA methylase IME4
VEARDGIMSAMPISAIIVGERHRKDYGDISELARSIADLGLLQPIVIAPDGKLIAGARRIKAFKELGRKEIPTTVIDLDKVVLGEYAENTFRKAFTLSEVVEIADAIEPIEVAKAKARQAEHGKTAPGRKKHSGEIPPSVPGRSADHVARVVGKDRKTIAKARAVRDAAAEDPEKFGKLKEDMDRTGSVNGPFKRLKVRRQADAIRAEPPPLPGNGPYRVIVADPPWPYEIRQEDPSHRGALPYPTMSIDQICAMGDEVRRIAHEDCLLLLWTTNFFMRQAYVVLDSWGFEEKTIVTWFKNEMGMGDWLRGQTEHFIVAVRGKPTVVLTNETTALFGKVRGHSEKPAEFYAFVEKWAPAPRYAYLFSRCLRDGWDGHGDEYPSEAECAS